MEIETGVSREVSTQELVDTLVKINETKAAETPLQEIQKLTQHLNGMQSRLNALQNSLQREKVKSDLDVLSSMIGAISMVPDYESYPAEVRETKAAVILRILDVYSKIIESEFPADKTV